jgi:hypothetical protein
LTSCGANSSNSTSIAAWPSFAPSNTGTKYVLAYFSNRDNETVNNAIALHEPYDRGVVRVWNERHPYVRRDVDGRVMVNACRAVAHIDDGVRRRIERAVGAVASTVHLCVGVRAQQHGDHNWKDSHVLILGFLSSIAQCCKKREGN